MPFSASSPSCHIINKNSSYLLDITAEGLSLTSGSSDIPLFELKESILLAQGVAEGPDQIHCAYLKATGELCYSVVSAQGEQQTTTLGKLDTKTYRYDRLILLPINKVIHIFYAASHLALPDVWRVTHLFWNGRTWKSAQLGEVVHPRHPLYHVLVDSKSNLHVLMMTFLGNRSVLLSSFFNGAFHIWSNRQETLSISREVIDMTALITPLNTGYLFWAARQPGSDQFEIGCASKTKANDFMSTWQIENPPAVNINGPWRGLGAIYSEGLLSLLIHADEEKLFQFNHTNWLLTSIRPSAGLALQITQKSESIISHTNWLSEGDRSKTPLFAEEIRLSNVNKNENEFTFAPSHLDSSQLENEPKPLINDPVASPEPEVFTPSENTSPVQEKKDVLFSLIREIQEATSALVNNLQFLNEKVESIPLNLESLMKKNEETLHALQELEEKVNRLKSERQISAKKGFWERWFT